MSRRAPRAQTPRFSETRHIETEAADTRANAYEMLAVRFAARWGWLKKAGRALKTQAPLLVMRFHGTTIEIASLHGPAPAVPVALTSTHTVSPDFNPVHSNLEPKNVAPLVQFPSGIAPTIIRDS